MLRVKVFRNIEAVRKKNNRNQTKNAGHMNFTSLLFLFAMAFWKERIASKDIANKSTFEFGG